MDSQDDLYKPTVSDEYANKLHEWQEKIFKEQSTGETQLIDFLGRTFIVPPEVHPINPMSDLLGNSVLNEVKETDQVLDLGTGCGVNAILAASKSSNVLGTDINTFAITSARQNAKVNNVAARVIFRESNLFHDVSGKFDLIIFDPPFRWFAPRNIREAATTDENYKTLTTFFLQVDDYLANNGRILLCFGSSGDIDYLNQLIEKHNFKKEILAQRDLEKESIQVSYYTFRLTR